MLSIPEKEGHIYHTELRHKIDKGTGSDDTCIDNTHLHALKKGFAHRPARHWGKMVTLTSPFVYFFGQFF
jgi:hypothetical protein